MYKLNGYQQAAFLAADSKGYKKIYPWGKYGAYTPKEGVIAEGFLADIPEARKWWLAEKAYLDRRGVAPVKQVTFFPWP